MKKISVVVPCFNEEENVLPLSEAIIAELSKFPQYDYEIIFIDNDSRDNTRPILRGMCAENPRIRAIFNARNFGQFNSPYYGLLQATGDCAILMAADFQEPPALIPQFIAAWEEGYKMVPGVKTKSQENKIMYAIRGLYYKLVKKFSDVEQIEQFTGFGLYDRVMIDTMKQIDDSTPFLRGIVAEIGFKRKPIEFTQPQRRAGKTSNNFFRLFDAAMLSITSYTKVGLRMATYIGMVGIVVSFLIAVIYLILKLVNWDSYPAGMAPVLIGMCLLGCVQLFFIGMIGEYIMTINDRVKHRPLVVEEERVNFPTEKEMKKAAADKESETASESVSNKRQRKTLEAASEKKSEKNLETAAAPVNKKVKKAPESKEAKK